jgi:hypothetical protein
LPIKLSNGGNRKKGRKKSSSAKKSCAEKGQKGKKSRFPRFLAGLAAYRDSYCRFRRNFNSGTQP